MDTDTIEEYAALIRQHELFASWDDEAIEALLTRCQPRVYNVGEALWTAGHVGQEAFILLSGRVERTRTVRPDGQRVEQYSQPGQLFSLSSLVQPWEHTSSATPLERTEVLCLEREAFRALFDDEHPAAFHIVDAIAENLVREMRDSNRRLHKVFGQPAETLRTLRRRMREDG